MMKKLLLGVVLCILLVGVVCADEVYIITMTGDEWMSYNFDQKLGIVSGWGMAIYATWYFVNELAPDAEWIWHKHFPISNNITMGELVNKIDGYYYTNGYQTELFVVIGKIMEEAYQRGL